MRNRLDHHLKHRLRVALEIVPIVFEVAGSGAKGATSKNASAINECCEIAAEVLHCLVHDARWLALLRLAGVVVD